MPAKAAALAGNQAGPHVRGRWIPAYMDRAARKAAQTSLRNFRAGRERADAHRRCKKPRSWSGTRLLRSPHPAPRPPSGRPFLNCHIGAYLPRSPRLQGNGGHWMNNMRSKARAAFRSGLAVSVVLALSINASKADESAETSGNCGFRPESSIPRHDGSEPTAHTNFGIRPLATSAPRPENSAADQKGCPPRK
jgi:hypothetical protein